MATLARLDVAMGADVSGLRRGFSQAISETQKLATSINSTKIANPLNELASKPIVTRAKFLDALEKDFRATLVKLQGQLAQKLIDPTEFAARGRAAVTQLESQLKQGLAKLGASAQLGRGLEKEILGAIPRARAALDATLRQAAQRSQGVATVTPAITAAQAQTSARQGLRQLQLAFNAEAAHAKLALAEKMITPTQFRLSGTASAKAFNAGLIAQLSQLGASGGLTDKLRIEFAKELKKIGADGATEMRKEIENGLAHVDTTRLGSIASGFTSLGQKLTAAITVPLTALATAGVHFAAEAEQTSDIFARVFGPETKRVEQQLKSLQKVVAVDTDGLKRMAIAVQAALLPLGIVPAKAADMSVSLVQLASNMALLRRSTPEAEMEKLRLAMLGNIRGLREFNIALRAENIGAAAVTLGIAKLGEALTPQQRALTIYAALMAKTGIVNGLAAEQADKAAQGFRFLKRDLHEATEEIGNQLLPAIVPAVHEISKLLRAFNELSPSTRKMIVVIGLMAIAFGPVLVAIGGLLAGVAKMAVVISVLRAFGVGLTAIGGALLPGAAVLVGLGLLAAVLFKTALNAVKATIETARLRDELGQLSAAQRQQRADTLTLELASLTRLQTALRDKTKAPVSLSNLIPPETDQKLQAVGNDIARVRSELGLIAQMKVTTPLAAGADAASNLAGLLGTTGDIFDETLSKGKSALEVFVERGHRLLDFYREMRARHEDVSSIGRDVVRVFTDAERKLAGVKDKLSDDASALRRLAAQFRQEDIVKLVIGEQPEALRVPVELALTITAAAQTGLLSQARVFANDAAQELSKVFRISPEAVQRQLPELRRIILGLPSQLPVPSIPLILDFKAARQQLAPMAQLLADFQESITAVVFAQNQLNLAEAQGAGGAAAQALARSRLVVALQQLQKVQAALAKSVTLGNLGAQEKVLQAIRDAMKTLQEAGVDVTKTLGSSTSALSRFVSAGRDISSILQGLGAIDENAGKVADSILNAADAAGRLRAASGPSGDVFAQISAGIGIIGSAIAFGKLLFGRSPEEQERRRIMRDNTQAIASLQLELRGFTNSVGQQAALAAQLRTPALVATIQKFAADQGKHLGLTTASAIAEHSQLLAKDFVALMAQLNALGLTLEDLNTIAKLNGITLLDSKGRIVAQSLADLAKKLELSALAAVRFAQTLDDQRAAIDLFNRAFEIKDTPQQAINDSLALIRKLAPDLFDKFFKGIDVGNPAAMRGAIQKLVTAFIANLLDPKLFGQLDKGDLVSLINTLLDALEHVADAAQDVSESLLNVPEGFKVERARFRATLADVREGLAVPPRPTPPSIALPDYVTPIADALSQQISAQIATLQLSVPSSVLTISVDDVTSSLDTLPQALTLTTSALAHERDALVVALQQLVDEIAHASSALSVVPAASLANTSRAVAEMTSALAPEGAGFLAMLSAVVRDIARDLSRDLAALVPTTLAAQLDTSERQLAMSFNHLLTLLASVAQTLDVVRDRLATAALAPQIETNAQHVASSLDSVSVVVAGIAVDIVSTRAILSAALRDIAALPVPDVTPLRALAPQIASSSALITTTLVSLADALSIARTQLLDALRALTGDLVALAVTPSARAIVSAPSASARASAAVTQFVFRDGAIVISGANKSAETLFDEVVDVAKRRTRAVSPTLPASAAFDL